MAGAACLDEVVVVLTHQLDEEVILPGADHHVVGFGHLGELLRHFARGAVGPDAQQRHPIEAH